MSDVPPELRTVVRLLTSSAGPPVALPWAPAGAGPADLLGHAARRTGTATATRLSALRARRRLRVVRPVRGSLRPGTRDQVRRRLGSGWVAAPSGGPTLAGRILAEASAEPVADLSVGADGAVRVPVRSPSGPALLRMGLSGTPADPGHAAQALRALAGHPQVPGLLRSGRCEDVTWVLEQRLPGRRPAGLAPGLVEEVAALLAALPAAASRPDPTADAAVLAALVPAPAGRRVLRAATEVAAAPAAASAQVAHGDLWSGNLLVSRGALTGVVDWDAWRASGVAGVDLLHLVATDRRIGTRASLGEVWLGSPWDDQAFAGPAARAWPGWGADPESRRAVGIAWWIGQLAADLRRNPALGDDEGWVGRNVTAVAGCL